MADQSVGRFRYILLTMESNAFIESRKVTDAARIELDSLRRRAEELQAYIEQEGIPTIQHQNEAAVMAVGEKWHSAVGIPSPANHPRVLGSQEAIKLQLTPEEHDERMDALLGILQENGITKAIKEAEATSNPHLVDDFHRVLVEWVREGLPAKESDQKKYQVPLSLSLYEVTLPQAVGDKNKTGDPAKTLHEFISLMEQFYRGMLQMDTKQHEYFSFEITKPARALYTALYIAVPRPHKALFEKQLLSLYPSARVVEKRDDYNVFVDGADTMAIQTKFAERSIYSLRTFDMFSNDPLDVLLNAFSKLDETGEGAALQFVISPNDKGLLKRYQNALRNIHEGASIEEATDVETGFSDFANMTVALFSPRKKLPIEERPRSDDPRLKNIERKISSPILLTNIRIVVSAKTPQRAKEILEDIQAPFQQFTDTAGNRLDFKEVQRKKIVKFIHMFSYRLLDESSAMPLSALELATMAHLPHSEAREAAPSLRQDKSQTAAPPVDLPQSGTLLGISRYRDSEMKVYIQPEDRLRHFYLIGQTGTGKSALLKNMVVQDICSGAGVCFIDPHGIDVLDILSTIPKERVGDVIYFDPAHIERPMGLNMLEYDQAHPEQKTLVVDELLGIFKKLFGAVPESMGPAFEQYFRNAALLVMEDPASGNTLLDISRVFSDSAFRTHKLMACKNPVVKRFWQDIAMKASGEQGLENYAPYVTNKFDAFTTNEIVRPIIAQQKSAFNFREIMDTHKILLVNLAKGRIGELNSKLLGLVIVGKFLIAALSRADSFGKDLPPFYLHIDEFQNFATPSIATIFSEARKYKLSLTVAHQFISQLTDDIRDSVFGNVGSICAFRVGAGDVEFLEKQFTPVFTDADLMRVDNFNAHLRLLIKGKPAQPFNIETLPFQSGSMEHVTQMQEISFLTYGRPRAEIEAEVAHGLSNVPQQPETLANN